jgi:hypothetical protein
MLIDFLDTKNSSKDLKNMETVTLTIRKTIGGEPVRYPLEVSKEVAIHYYKIRKEQPELNEMKAYDKAAENQ